VTSHILGSHKTAGSRSAILESSSFSKHHLNTLTLLSSTTPIQSTMSALRILVPVKRVIDYAVRLPIPLFFCSNSLPSLSVHPLLHCPLINPTQTSQLQSNHHHLYPKSKISMLTQALFLRSNPASTPLKQRSKPRVSNTA
jgi:hypothetical protein